MVTFLVAVLLAGSWPLQSASALYDPGIFFEGNKGVQNHGYMAVAYGQGTFVAAGTFGNIARSEDGFHWESDSVSEYDPMVTFNGAAYGNNRFVLVRNDGLIQTSTNGEHWTPAASGVTSELRDVRFIEGQFIAVGDAGVMLTSSDGLSWTQTPVRTSGGDTLTDDFTGITYGNGMYAISHSTSDRSILVASSVSGPWSRNVIHPSQNPTVITSVTYVHDRFYALTQDEQTLISADAGSAEWKAIQVGYEYTEYAYFKGNYFIFNYPLYTSPTGDEEISNWQKQYHSINNYTATVAVADRLVAVGTYGISVTLDGTEWTKTLPVLSDFAYGNGTYVAVGEGDEMNYIAVSTDLTNWKEIPFSLEQEEIKQVIFADNHFIAYGNRTFAVSTDGIQWEIRNSPSLYGLYPTGLVYGNGTLVMSSSNSDLILTSKDLGRTWTEQSMTNPGVIEFADGQFIAGTMNSLMYSEDAVNWHNAVLDELPELFFPLKMVHGNGKYYMFGVTLGDEGDEEGSEVGYGYTSTDGRNWTHFEFESTEFIPLRVAYSGDIFLGSTMGVDWYSSPDGISWSPYPLGNHGTVENIKFFNGRFIALGEGGLVLTSRPVEPVAGTIDKISKAGFTVTLDQAVPGLTAGDFTLSGGVTVDSVTETNGGLTYQVSAALAEGETYTVSVTATGYRFTVGNVTIPKLPEPTATPVPEPTVTPTATPDTEPTAAPTTEPTAAPTTEPTAAPTTEPTAAPTTEPTAAPTTEPTAVPTTEPTAAPTTEPTAAPTTAPTTAPTSASGGGTTAAAPAAAATPAPATASLGDWTITVNVERAVNNGVTTDTLTLPADKTLEAVTKTTNTGGTALRIAVADARNQAGALNVQLPAASLQLIKQAGLDLGIATSYIETEVAAETLAAGSNDLYFRFTPVKDQQQREAVRQRALQTQVVQSVSNQLQPSVIATPVEIETNISSSGEVAVTLPLAGISVPDDAVQREAFLNSLAVYVEQDNNIKLVAASPVPAGNSTAGINFTAGPSTIFALLQWQGVNVSSQLTGSTAPSVPGSSYINGFPDGTFRPEAGVTRAQMAAMLARLLQSNGQPQAAAAAYPDVSQGHWAGDSISLVTGQGLMIGDTNGSFNPGQEITRAQLATIAARYAQLQPGTAAAQAYTDTSGHWAANEIAAVQAAGLMQGYSDGTFRPGQMTTRAEAVTVLNNLFNLDTSKITGSPAWRDVSTSHWAYNDIEAASRD
ncbi:hypothetical protein C2I18_21600 [Paenibacillus sp. PK3_47]|nr:hypothetical protein C2I18_21600 [Paenibacillus sp. PK3_47]